MATVEETAETGGSLPTASLSVWSNLLSIGGLLMVAGTLGYSVVEMRSDEQQIASLEQQLATGAVPVEPEAAVPVEPAAEPVPTPTVTETVTNTVIQPDEDRIRQLEEKIDELTGDLGAANMKLDSARQVLASRDATVRQQETRIGQLGDELDKAKMQLDGARKLVATRDRTVSQLESRIGDINTALDRANQQLERMKRDAALQQDKLNQCTAQLRNSQSQVEELKRSCSANSNGSARTTVVR